MVIVIKYVTCHHGLKGNNEQRGRRNQHKDQLRSPGWGHIDIDGDGGVDGDEYKLAEIILSTIDCSVFTRGAHS